MKMSNKLKIILFVIALVALYLIIYLVPKISGALISTYTVEYGELRTEDETEGFIVRNETVYVAASGGTEDRYIKEGALVRRGNKVMSISGNSDRKISSKYEDILSRLGKNAISTSDYVAVDGGIIAYCADGYESILTPDTMEKYTLEDFEKLDQDSVVDLKRDNVAKGEPVFKTVDRTQWYLVCFIDKKNRDRYAVGNEVTVDFGNGDTVYFDIETLDNMDGKTRVILTSDYYFDKFTSLRRADISLVTSDSMGLIVEDGSITTKKGQKGVYVKTSTGKYSFVPIQIIDDNGTNCVVKDTYFYDSDGNMFSTLENYDEVLKNPDNK